MNGYFYGWYMKCQSKDSTVAFISARHKNGTSETSSLQVITDDGAWNIDMPGTAFKKDCKNIFLGKNRFGKNGIRVNIDNPDARIKGKLDFGQITPIIPVKCSGPKGMSATESIREPPLKQVCVQR